MPKSKTWYKKEIALPSLVNAGGIITAAIITGMLGITAIALTIYYKLPPESKSEVVNSTINPIPTDGIGESAVVIDKATVTLDLSKNWHELNENPRSSHKEHYMPISL